MTKLQDQEQEQEQGARIKEQEQDLDHLVSIPSIMSIWQAFLMASRSMTSPLLS